MTDTLYTSETRILYFNMWDTSVSEEMPEYRPHDAWYEPEDIESITLTIRKPGTTPDEVKTLAGGGVTYTGRVGRWQADFDFDGGAGTYFAIFVGVTTDGFTGVEVSKMRVKGWPS